MPPAKSTLKALVADDEAPIGTFLREALIPLGYAADLCGDGDAAIRRLGEQRYSLLITDLLMPRKTGVEIVHELRGRGDEIPIVLMSSFISDEVLATCAGLTHLAFLQKPFGLSDLRAAIERAVSSVRC